MGALIDSSVLVAAERGQLDLDALLDAHGDEDFALSSITASELLHGVHRAKNEARRNRREAYVEALLAGFPVLPFDIVAARVHARLSARAAAAGAAVGAHDLIIAAIDTGMRRRQLLSLQWKHVLGNEKGRPKAFMLAAEHSKTNKPRTVPTTSTRLQSVLERRRLGPDGKKLGPEAHVFGTEVGELVKNVKTAWKAACRRALRYSAVRRRMAPWARRVRKLLVGARGRNFEAVFSIGVPGLTAYETLLASLL